MLFVSLSLGGGIKKERKKHSSITDEILGWDEINLLNLMLRQWQYWISSRGVSYFPNIANA